MACDRAHRCGMPLCCGAEVGVKMLRKAGIRDKG